MSLIKPTKQYEVSWVAALAEFEVEKQIGFWNMPNKPDNLDKYIQLTEDFAHGKNLPDNWVASTTYWLVDNEEFIGHVNIRHELNDHLLKIGGHIGYAIRPAQRHKGYGSKILELVLPKAKELGFSRVLVTCDESNVGSQKIIEKNGGQLENIVPGDNGLKRRYWIDL